MYLTREQLERLRQLSDSTHVASAEYIRQGVDFILAKHEAQLPGQAQLPLEG